MYSIYCKTDQGNIRENNEDSFMVNKKVLNKEDYYEEIASNEFITAVADGVGGNNWGEVASNMCLEKLSKVQLPVSSDELIDTINRINKEIIEYGKDNPKYSAMATTLAGLTCFNELITIFHVGDSRVYRFRNGFLRQFTIDDSLVQVFFSLGKISKEDMEKHPDKNVLIQTIGGKKSDRKIDIHIQEVRSKFKEEDIFLICTDGLSDMVDYDTIEDIIKNNKNDVKLIANNLINEAKRNGGHDNITLILIKRD